MQKKFKLAAIALCYAPLTFAQTTVTQPDEQANNAVINESAFTFTEAQLGEDDNVSQNLTIVGSNSNAYASEVGYRFSAARFKYRAFGAKYNDIYINGNPVNDVERGEFRYSFVGGLNNQTRSVEAALPFENNTFSLSAMGGSNNYNFRPSAMPTGHRVSLAGANRNYTFRGMYSYNSGLSEKGWAFSAGLTYHWANMETAQIEGTHGVTRWNVPPRLHPPTRCTGWPTAITTTPTGVIKVGKSVIRASSTTMHRQVCSPGTTKST